MALEATSNEKMQQSDTSDLDKSEDLNQPVKFTVKRRRTKMKGKSTRVNQEGNEPNEKDQRTPQTVEQHIPITSSHDVVIPPLNLYRPEISLIHITQLDNQLSNSEDLMMIDENTIGDMQVSLPTTTHSWLHPTLQRKKKVVQMVPPPFDVISSFL